MGGDGQPAWLGRGRLCYRRATVGANPKRARRPYGERRTAVHSRLAALLAVCVTLAMSQPRLGLVVHHHGGAGTFHVHTELAGGHPHDRVDAHASDVGTASGHVHVDDQDHDQASDHHADDHHIGLVAHFRTASHDHDVAHHDELAARPAPPPASDDVSLTAGTFRLRWHTHGTQPFQHANLPVPPIVQAPQPGARLALLPPHRRGEAEPVPGRSRAPPSLQSS